MKIAVYHELHKGGARRSTNEFARQLKNLGNTVDLFTIDYKNEEKLSYSHIYPYKFKSKTWNGKNPKVRIYKDTIELFKLNRLNKKIANKINSNYDLVFICASQFIESPFILKYLTIPSFFYCHDPYYRIIYEPELFKPVRTDFIRNYYERLNRYLRKRMDIANIKSANHIIFNSEFTRSQFKKVYGIDGSVIHYGVDSDHFFPKKTNKKFDLLFIGSYDALDGYPFFKKIINKMKFKPNVRVVAFENEWLTDKELINVYRQSKIFVSVSYREPLGMVPMEVMSCGIPVVAVDEAGHKETIVNNKTGYLLKRNVNLFVKEIENLLKNEELLKKFGENARKEMKDKWDWKVKGRELEDFLKFRI